jgi:hypothetical protein
MSKRNVFLTNSFAAAATVAALIVAFAAPPVMAAGGTAASEASFAPPPAVEQHAGISDVRSEFEHMSKATPRNIADEQAFVANKMRLLQTQPGLDPITREALANQLAKQLKLDLKAPPPGGVGYGMFYNAAFKSGFATGTSFYYEIVCPTRPGGNVSTFLYLTATNRSALGVEAFVSYNGQNQTTFRVFDWARADHWQTNVSFANLGNYLRRVSAHGSLYQELPVWNSTYQISASNWRNEVLLYNRVQNTWDLIYRYDYPATEAQQKTGWIGSWGPIVETFQPSYNGTKRMGALRTQLISRNSAGQWGAWRLLAASDSFVRTDNVGFRPVFIDPNYSWVVRSPSLTARAETK